MTWFPVVTIVRIVLTKGIDSTRLAIGAGSDSAALLHSGVLSAAWKGK